MRVFLFVLLSLILFFNGVSGYAQTPVGYVSDKLILTFRQGPGPSFQVLKTLESNTRLMILEEKDGYYKVRLSSGETGWVDQKFVTFDTPKTEIIEKLQQDHEALKQQFDALSDAHDRLKDKMAAMSENPDDLYEILEKSKQLENENIRLSMEIEKLENESDHLFKSRMIKWFLAGFGVVFFGWILGQTVSGRSRQRNSLLG